MKIFGVEHIIYLVVSILATVVGLVLIKKFCKSEKSQKICIKVTAAVFLIIMVLNRIFCVTLQYQSLLLPYSTCAVIGTALALLMLVCKRGGYHFMASPIWHCLVGY